MTAASSSQKREILLLTGSDTENVYIKLVLGSSQYNFGTAHTGEQGIAYGRLVNPDLILVDLEIPPQGALDIAEQIGADPRTRGTPLVLLGERDALAALADEDLGRFSAVLIRPIVRAELCSVVEGFFTRPGAGAGKRDRNGRGRDARGETD